MTSVEIIGDADTVLAFALGGVPGHVTQTAGDTEAAVAAVVEQVRQAGGVLPCPTLLLITHGAAAKIRAYLNALMLDPAAPVVLEVPGFGEPLGESPLAGFVRRILGVPV
jgi:vacuolar-type H+-ATPase subunit F/Vma7